MGGVQENKAKHGQLFQYLKKIRNKINCEGMGLLWNVIKEPAHNLKNES